MKTLIVPLTVGLVLLLSASDARARQGVFERLAPDVLDVTWPSVRVSGGPGRLALQSQACRADVPHSGIRRRIVDIAVQEWGYFGFPVVDETNSYGLGRPGSGFGGAPALPLPRRLPRPGADVVARTAVSVAGYWAVTPEGAWIVERQNGAFNGPGGAARWRDPWSAAFVSWVMCEAGLDASARFRRAVAHHVYVDQAIRARDGHAPEAAFAAYDVGERRIAPGDMLCRARRPAYGTIAERRRQMGVGARSHCDIVVGVDEAGARILAIGGNVRGTVGLKLLPTVRTEDGTLRPLSQALGEGPRPMFAHLQLRTDPIEPDALYNSPTMQALACTREFAPPAQLVAAGLATRKPDASRC
jgi:hypothetical protein